MRKDKKFLQSCIVGIGVSIAAHGEMVAAWDFNDFNIGSIITSAVDSVSGLVAEPNINNVENPRYVAGNDGGAAAGFGGISGVLQVSDSEEVLGVGFRALIIKFDVNLEEDASETAVFLRNGLYGPFNIYLLSGNRIGVTLRDDDGVTTSTASTLNAALDASAGWQTVSVVWDVGALSISVDGIAQTLSTGELSKEIIGIDALSSSDAPMGIGGIVRDTGTIGQYLRGAIDNIQISGRKPERSTLSLLGFGLLGVDVIRRSRRPD